MKAIVVYESYWGNTAAVAKAVAEGIGPDARALSTSEADAAALSDAHLIVTGSPIIAFGLPSDKTRRDMQARPDKKAPSPPDLSHPSIRSWIEALPKTGRPGAGEGGVGVPSVKVAAFETGFKMSPGGSAAKMLKMLEALGYAPVAKKQRFLVQGSYGPVKEGELERAKAWGAELAKTV
jgi:hypothetical protein